MLSKIIAWFDRPQEPVTELTAEEAEIVLMVEIMTSDHDLDKREQASIAQRIVARSGASLAEAEALVSKAQEKHSESHDLFQFTKVLNGALSVDEKMNLIVDLWRTALADGVIDKHEDHMIRRISDLLHLHHSHFIKAKHLALDEG